jgi:hypothetical protein
MPKYISVTWEDIEWLDDDPDSQEIRTGGFVVENWRSELSDNMSRREVVALHKSAQIDLDSLIDCEFCSEYLYQDYTGNWVDYLGSSKGINFYEGINADYHTHGPDKMWYEVLVDTLEEYGAYEDNMDSYYSDYFVPDYSKNIQRQYAVHLDWNVSPDEFELIQAELKRRKENRKQLAENYPRV